LGSCCRAWSRAAELGVVLQGLGSCCRAQSRAAGLKSFKVQLFFSKLDISLTSNDKDFLRALLNGHFSSSLRRYEQFLRFQKKIGVFDFVGERRKLDRF
jgi:hypothetical protein